MESYARIIERVIPHVEFHQNRYARALDSVVSAETRWLDIGAGEHIHHGWLGTPEGVLARRARFVIGCDLVREHLARNTHLAGAAVADAYRLPFPAGSFDLVTSNMVLEHIGEPERFFAEVARVISPGGRFVFVTPNLAHPVIFVASIALSAPVRRLAAHRWEGRELEHIFHTHYRANTERALRALGGRNGFRIAELDVFPSYPFFRRPAIAVAAEAIWIRSLSSPLLRRFGSNILGIFERLSARTAA